MGYNTITGNITIPVVSGGTRLGNTTGGIVNYSGTVSLAACSLTQLIGDGDFVFSRPLATGSSSTILEKTGLGKVIVNDAAGANFAGQFKVTGGYLRVNSVLLLLSPTVP